VNLSTDEPTATTMESLAPDERHPGHQSTVPVGTQAVTAILAQFRPPLTAPVVSTGVLAGRPALEDFHPTRGHRLIRRGSGPAVADSTPR
jgi:hypothetical protein